MNCDRFDYGLINRFGDRPETRHQENGDRVSEDGEDGADFEEVAEAVAARAVNHQAGGFERGQIRAARGDGDHDCEGAGIKAELYGRLDGDGHYDDGGSLV